MKRLIDYHLKEWVHDPLRQPLLLRGARQVGKTHAVRKLGKSFTHFVEINLEELEKAATAFQGSLTATDLIIELEVITQKPIKPGKTLLFLDEAQAVPRAITALRYFYEQIPELHVIAAGSLLDFALEHVGIPVGRVQSLYVYPMSFVEFLAATDYTFLLERLIEHDPQKEFSTTGHALLLEALGKYLALGGMPQVINCWKDTKDPLLCTRLQNRIISTYRQDFGKYAQKAQIKYVDLVFDAVPNQLGKKFKFSKIDGEYRKRELAPALDLLDTAGIIHKVFHSSGQGIPLGAQANPKDFKVLFSDVGIAQSILEYDLSDWFLNPLKEFINKGELVESFVGLELLAYSTPHKKKKSFYWHRESRTSDAEIDYLLQIKKDIFPIEVKSGKGYNLHSLKQFLESHQKSPYGIKFSTNNFAQLDALHCYPLYAVSKLLLAHDEELKKAITSLLDTLGEDLAV